MLSLVSFPRLIDDETGPLFFMRDVALLCCRLRSFSARQNEQKQIVWLNHDPVFNTSTANNDIPQSRGLFCYLLGYLTRLHSFRSTVQRAGLHRHGLIDVSAACIPELWRYIQFIPPKHARNQL